MPNLLQVVSHLLEEEAKDYNRGQMLHLKNKIKNIKSGLAGLTIAVALIFGLTFTVFGATAKAASIPLCQAPQVISNGGEAGLCFDSNGKPNYLANNPDGNTNPEDGHCYVAKQTGFGYAYFNAGPAPKYGCDTAPFNQAKVFTCSDGTNIVGNSSTDQKTVCSNHGNLSGSSGLAIDCNSAVITRENCGIVWYLQLLINTLSALVGIVVVIVIIVAGIQWSTAGNNPQQLSAAKNRIFNAILALLVFIFMYAFLQWVVPGGIFHS